MVSTTELLQCLVIGILCVGYCDVTAESVEHNAFTLEDYKYSLKGRRLAHEFFNYIQEQQQSTNDTSIGEGPNRFSVRQCAAQLNELTKGLQQGSIWALRVIDSWGNIPTGILYGNIRDLGNYDECVRLNKEINSEMTIQGKYCPASIPIGNLLPVDGLPSMKIATCIPAACNADYVDIIFKEFLQRTFNLTVDSGTTVLNERSCILRESEPLTGAAIATIVIMSTMGSLVLLATLADYYYTTGNKKLHRLVNAFSLRYNARQLFRIVDYSRNPKVIPCLNGIRCLSLIWVIFGHTCMTMLMSVNLNIFDIFNWAQTPFSMLLTQAFFSVDSFFFLSALLLTMGVMRELDKNSGKLNLPFMYLHRFLRLTPILGFAILLHLSLTYLGDGPQWKSTMERISGFCRKNWWVTLLYINNYFRNEERCMGQSWYLGVDMQLYILSPIVIIALWKWGRKAVAGTVLLLLLLWACLFSTIMINDYAIFPKRALKFVDSMSKIYYPTHMRTSPWIVGLLFGYYLHLRRGRRVILPTYAVSLGWLACFALIATSIFSLYEKSQIPSAPFTTLDSALFISLSRIAWPLALCWLVFGCVNGYGGPIDSFLGSPLWQPLARISYCMFLFHLLILGLNDGRIRTIQYFSSYDIMLKFWETFGFTILISVFLYLLIETPLAGVEQYLLIDRWQSKPKEQVTTTIEVATVNLAAEVPDSTNTKPDQNQVA